MLQEVTPLSAQGLVKLGSMDSLRLYLRDLLEEYEKEADRYGEKVGALMRILERDTRGKEVKKLREIEWRKVGMVMVADRDPNRGTLELMIEAMEDVKAKAERTAEVLTNVSELEDIGVPDGASILLYLRHGVPMRIVIDNQKNPEVDVMVYTTYLAPHRRAGTHK